jgi:endonuclease/exonuclease/phosphatase family metal-dependent hydrolase
VGRCLILSGLLRKLGVNSPLSRSNAVASNIRTAARAFTEGRLMPIPDILALQEADKRTLRAGGHYVAVELAIQLNKSWIQMLAHIPRGLAPRKRQWWLDFEEQIALDDTGDTGLALISNALLDAPVRIDLPWKECPWRPRLAMAVTVAVGARNLRLINAHIDPHESLGGQHDQLEVILSEAETHDGPIVILGDFNTLSKKKCIETRRVMEARGYITPFPTGTPTWHGAGLRLHADWIFVRDALINRWGVAKPLSVSDHWPIWAEIDLE